MTEQHTAAMRFVRGASAPAPLADPATEEEAVLVSDPYEAMLARAQAARLRYEDAYRRHCHFDVRVAGRAVPALAADVVALVERARALETSARNACGCWAGALAVQPDASVARDNTEDPHV